MSDEMDDKIKWSDERGVVQPHAWFSLCRSNQMVNSKSCYRF